MVRKPWVAPQLQGFRAQAININTFNFEQRNLDRNFLNELTEDVWREPARRFQRLTGDGSAAQFLLALPTSGVPVAGSQRCRSSPRPVAPNGTEETEMNTGSKSVTVKYIANYWRVCWCNKLVRTYATREEAEAAAASLRHEAAG
jgi:hypothetical protein